LDCSGVNLIYQNDCLPSGSFLAIILFAGPAIYGLYKKLKTLKERDFTLTQIYLARTILYNIKDMFSGAPAPRKQPSAVNKQVYLDQLKNEVIQKLPKNKKKEFEKFYTQAKNLPIVPTGAPRSPEHDLLIQEIDVFLAAQKNPYDK